MRLITLLRKRGRYAEVVFLRKGEKISQRIFQDEFQAFYFAKTFMKAQQKFLENF